LCGQAVLRITGLTFFTKYVLLDFTNANTMEKDLIFYCGDKDIFCSSKICEICGEQCRQSENVQKKLGICGNKLKILEAKEFIFIYNLFE